jgi:hypothetical protein
MTNKVLYANGDSFVFGMESIEDCSKDPRNKNYAFPKFIADKLGYDSYINNAYNGATNEFIFRQTIFDLQILENQGINPKDVFVVIGWTALNRVEVDGGGYLDQIPGFDVAMNLPDGPGSSPEFKDFGTMFVNPGIGLTFIKHGKKIDINQEIVNWCGKYLWTEAVQLPSQEARMIALHEILKVKGYKHIFVNTVCPLERTTQLDLTCKNFYKIDSESFYMYVSDLYKNELRKWNHYSSVAHKGYAEHLLNYIEKNIIE